MKLSKIYLFTLVVLVLSVYLALRFGSAQEATDFIVLSLRMPRTLLAFGVGAGLALSGVALQSAFANPLCEPYTLGISSGATLGAVIGISLGINAGAGGILLTALLGALLFTFILLRRSTQTTSASQLLLTGVMLSFLGSGLVSLWMALADSNGIQAALDWLMGDLSRARLQSAWFALGTSSLLAMVLFLNSSKMDAFLLGDETASSLGVDVVKFRRRLIIISSLLVSVCVSSAGMIGFVGLLIPHIIRLRLGSTHRRVIPLAFLWGGIFLIMSDLISRIIARPTELPVGVITALVGAPTFIAIMSRNFRRDGHA